MWAAMMNSDVITCSYKVFKTKIWLSIQRGLVSKQCRQRGIGEEDAVALVVNGFCKEVLQALPMEFAMEAQALVAISLEGSVG